MKQNKESNNTQNKDDLTKQGKAHKNKANSNDNFKKRCKKSTTTNENNFKHGSRKGGNKTNITWNGE